VGRGSNRKKQAVGRTVDVGEKDSPASKKKKGRRMRI